MNQTQKKSLPEENIRLLKLYADGDESVTEKLIELNMGLVTGNSEK